MFPPVKRVVGYVSRVGTNPREAGPHQSTVEKRSTAAQKRQVTPREKRPMAPSTVLSGSPTSNARSHSTRMPIAFGRRYSAPRPALRLNSDFLLLGRSRTTAPEDDRSVLVLV